MILCNHLLDKRDRCLLYTYLQFPLRQLFPRPCGWGFSHKFWIGVYCPGTQKTLPQFEDESNESWYPNDFFSCSWTFTNVSTTPTRSYIWEWPPPPPRLYYNIRLWKWSYFLTSCLHLPSFLFIERSKDVMIAQQSFGGNCQPVQNWLQGQMKQNRANRWRSLENLSKFSIFSYFFTVEKGLHRKNLLGTFVFCLFCFVFFPSGLQLSMRLVLWRIPGLSDVHTHIHTLFTGSHYDTWKRIMRLSLY